MFTYLCMNLEELGGGILSANKSLRQPNTVLNCSCDKPALYCNNGFFKYNYNKI